MLFSQTNALCNWIITADSVFKVHVWGGISKKGATSIVIFTDTLTAMRYNIRPEFKAIHRKMFPRQKLSIPTR